LLRGGRTRRCSARPVPRRRCRRQRSRANGAKRGCLGGSWGLGELVRLIGGAFYRLKRRGTRRPEARRLGGPGCVWSSLRSGRSRSRAGRVMAWPRGAVGLLWRGQVGRHCAGTKVTGRGAWVQNSFPLRFSWLGSGLGTLGSTVVMPRSMATGFEQTRTVINTVIRIRLICFCQCSTKCPQEV
jgi:hypothetical protein